MYLLQLVDSEMTISAIQFPRNFIFQKCFVKFGSFSTGSSLLVLVSTNPPNSKYSMAVKGISGLWTEAVCQASGVLKDICTHVLFVKFVQSRFTCATLIFICVRPSASRGVEKCISVQKWYGHAQKMPVFCLILGVQTLGHLVKQLRKDEKMPLFTVFFLCYLNY